MNIHNKIISYLLSAIWICSCATGSYIITGTTRDPISFEDVVLYLEEPKNYETIGIVNAKSGAGWDQQGSMDYAIEELKKQAAKLGANGVLITATGSENSTTVGGHGTGYLYAVPVNAQTVTGKAIYVHE